MSNTEKSIKTVILTAESSFVNNCLPKYKAKSLKNASYHSTKQNL